MSSKNKAATETAANSNGVQTIDLSKMPLMYLRKLFSEMDQDIQFYTESLQSLKMAQSRFQESHASLERVSGVKEKNILVPLTGSMYVPGVMETGSSGGGSSSSDKVIIEIGTGYYVEKTIEDAMNYFERKVKYVGEQAEKVIAIGEEKKRLRQAILKVMTDKLQQQQGSDVNSSSSNGGLTSPSIKT